MVGDEKQLRELHIRLRQKVETQVRALILPHRTPPYPLSISTQNTVQTQNGFQKAGFGACGNSYRSAFDVLLLERTQRRGFWQSVTGSQEDK